MVDRDATSIELFVRIPAPLLPEKFAAFPPGFLAENGQVDVTPFRNGTWDHGDAFFEDVVATIGGDPVVFEAMSMMVHPPEFDTPFRDPIDAFTAISVCNVPVGIALLPVDTLVAYLGYIAYPVDGYGDLSLTFPAQATVQIEQFDQGRPVDDRTVDVADSQPIVLDAVTHKTGWFDWLFN